MENLSYHTKDKSDWGQGPWMKEPDKRQWLDKATGMPCLIVRNDGGALCGYVGVTKEHPAFGKDYSYRCYEDKNSNECKEYVKSAYEAINDIEVHGGLTFASKCSNTSDEAQGICHVDLNGPEVWWFGFDCAHLDDVCPAYSKELQGFRSIAGDGIYRDFDYVTSEVTSLAAQLKALGEKNEK